MYVYTLCSQLTNPCKTEGKVSEMNNEPQIHKAFRRLKKKHLSSRPYYSNFLMAVVKTNNGKDHKQATPEGSQS